MGLIPADLGIDAGAFGIVLGYWGIGNNYRGGERVVDNGPARSKLVLLEFRVKSSVYNWPRSRPKTSICLGLLSGHLWAQDILIRYLWAWLPIVVPEAKMVWGPNSTPLQDRGPARKEFALIRGPTPEEQVSEWDRALVDIFYSLKAHSFACSVLSYFVSLGPPLGANINGSVLAFVGSTCVSLR